MDGREVQSSTLLKLIRMYFSLLNWALVLFLRNYYPVVSHVKTNPGVSQYAALFSFDFIFLQPILAFEFVGYCLIGSFIMPSVDLIMCYSIDNYYEVKDQ